MPGLGITADPAKYEQAIHSLRRRVPMTREKWDALSAAEREFAFTVSNVAQADLVAETLEAVKKAMENGTTLADFKAEIGAQLEEAWGGPDPFRVETIFRTNVQSAYNAGRHEIISDPVVKEARPYWRFDAVEDDRITEVCEKADGTVLPADDPWWAEHTPPLHYNCRSQIVPLSVEEAERTGISERAPSAEPSDGFGLEPSDEGGEDWSPNTREYPRAVAEILRERLGR